MLLIDCVPPKLPLPCAAGPALLGEAAMRRKDAERSLG